MEKFNPSIKGDTQMDKVRFGIIGVGNMGSSHAKNLFNGEIKDAVLGAICDLKESRRQ